MNAKVQYSVGVPAAAALQPVALRHCPPRRAAYVSPRAAQVESWFAQRNPGSSVLYTCPAAPATHRHSANAHAAPALRIAAVREPELVTLFTERHGPTTGPAAEGCQRAGSDRRPVTVQGVGRRWWLRSSAVRFGAQNAP